MWGYLPNLFIMAEVSWESPPANDPFQPACSFHQWCDQSHPLERKSLGFNWCFLFPHRPHVLAEVKTKTHRSIPLWLHMGHWLHHSVPNGSEKKKKKSHYRRAVTHNLQVNNLVASICKIQWREWVPHTDSPAISRLPLMVAKLQSFRSWQCNSVLTLV